MMPYAVDWATGGVAYDIRFAQCLLDTVGPQGVILRPNEAFAAITGCAAADTPRTLDALLHPEDREAFWAVMGQGMQADGRAACEHRIVCRGRTVRMISCMLQDRGKNILLIADADEVARVREDARPFLEAIPCGVALFRYAEGEGGALGASRLLYANGKFHEMLGHTPQSLHQAAPDHLQGLLPPEEIDLVSRRREQAVRTPQVPVQVYFSAIRGDGERVYLLATMIGLGLAKDGQDLLCVYQDMTALYAAQEALSAQAERIRYLVETTGERFIEYDVAADRLTMLARHGGQKERDHIFEGLLRGDGLQGFVCPDDLQTTRDALQAATAAPAYGSLDLRLTDEGEGGITWCRVHYTSVVDAQKQVVRVVGRFVNIDAEKREELALRDKAERDALTGLYCRGAAEMLMERFLANENEKQSNRRHALLMIDLDNFKQINDYFGHAFGDVVLTEIASIISLSFRTSDIVGRLGGDEFIVLMRNYRSIEAIEQVCGRICGAITKKYKSALSEIDLSASIGVACFPEHGADLQTLYEHADLANYEAKARGKNSWQVYDADMRLHYQAERAQEGRPGDALQRAVEETLLGTLHETNDRGMALRAGLEVVARAMHAQRAYLVMLGEDGAVYTDAGHHWCVPGHEVDLEGLNALPADTLSAFFSAFDENGMRIIGSLAEIPDALRGFYEACGVRSMLHYAFRRGKRISGFIGLDDCVREGRVPALWLREGLEAVSRVMLLFAKQGMGTEETIHLVGTTGVMDGLDHYTYIVEADTHELVFVNRRTLSLLPPVRVGELCHQTLHGLDAPCASCPIARLGSPGDADSAAQEMYFDMRHFWGKVFAAWLDVGRQGQYCLLQCVDVTAYKGMQAAGEV